MLSLKGWRERGKLNKNCQSLSFLSFFYIFFNNVSFPVHGQLPWICLHCRQSVVNPCFMSIISETSWAKMNKKVHKHKCKKWWYEPKHREKKHIKIQIKGMWRLLPSGTWPTTSLKREKPSWRFNNYQYKLKCNTIIQKKTTNPDRLKYKYKYTRSSK